MKGTRQLAWLKGCAAGVPGNCSSPPRSLKHLFCRAITQCKEFQSVCVLYDWPVSMMLLHEGARADAAVSSRLVQQYRGLHRSTNYCAIAARELCRQYRLSALTELQEVIVQGYSTASKVCGVGMIRRQCFNLRAWSRHRQHLTMRL